MLSGRRGAAGPRSCQARGDSWRERAGGEHPRQAVSGPSLRPALQRVALRRLGGVRGRLGGARRRRRTVQPGCHRRGPPFRTRGVRLHPRGSLSRGKRRTVHRGMDPQGELREVPRAGTRGGPGRLLSLGRGTAFTAAEWGGRTDTVPASDPPKGRGIPSPTAGGRQRPRRRGGSSAGVARCSRRRGGGSGDARGTTHPPTDRPAPLSRAAARRAGS